MRNNLMLVSLLFSLFFSCAHSCFIAQEKSKVIVQQGVCNTRYSPCSTFKIAISLMGYDEGILINATQPEFPFKRGYLTFLPTWKKSQNPGSWIKNSCVWYSQVITRKIGGEKFKSHVENFDYGNKDISGDKGKNNGLTHAWLSSSLEISPLEQILFLQKLVDFKLPVARHAHDMTRGILFLEDLPNGWKLYGKIGAGYVKNKHNPFIRVSQVAWFVGWIAKKNRTIVFAACGESVNIRCGPLRKKVEMEARARLFKLTQTC